MLKAESFFLLRSPALPEEYFKRQSSLENAANALFDDIKNDKLASSEEIAYFVSGLLIAAPGLIESIRRENTSKKDKNRAKMTLIKYMLRSTTRSTPFGLFATVTVGSISDSTEITLSDVSAIKFAATVSSDDFDAVCEVNRKEIHRKNIETVSRNRSIIKTASSYHFLKHERHKDHATTNKIKIKRDPVSDLVFKLSENPVRIKDLVKQLGVDIGVDDYSVIEIICKKLLSLGFLHFSGMPGLNVVDPHLHFLDYDRIESCASPSPAKSKRAQLLDRNIKDFYNIYYKSLKTNIYDFQSRFSSYIDVFDSEFQQFSEGDDYNKSTQRRKSVPHVVSVRNGNKCTISNTLIDRIMSVTSEVVKITSRELPEYRRFKDIYHSKFGANPTPLMLVLDEEYGINAAEVYDQKSQPNTYQSGLQTFLSDSLNNIKYLKSFSLEETVNLSDYSKDKNIDARQFSNGGHVRFSMRRIQSAYNAREIEILIHGINNGLGIEMMTRFGHAAPDLNPHFDRLNRRRSENYRRTVHADICRVDVPGHRMVALRPLSSFQAVINTEEDVRYGDTIRHIDLGDLHAVLINGEIEVLDLKKGFRVVPNVTSAHNWASPSQSNILRLLPLLGKKTLQTFFWPQELQQSDFLPRVHFNGVWLSPARWIIPNSILNLIKDGDICHKVEMFRKLAKAKGFPRHVLAGKGDKLLPIDMTDEQTIIAACSDLGNVIVESFQVSGGSVISSTAGLHFNEVVLPFFSENVIEPDVDFSSVSQFAHGDLEVFTPGSSWLFLSLYGSRKLLDQFITFKFHLLRQHFLHCHVKWFYIRYSEGGPHIRLRVQVDIFDNERLFREIKAILDSSVNDFELNIWKIETYRPEYYRYRGLKKIEFAEEIFCADSEFCSSLIKLCAGSEFISRLELEQVSSVLFIQSIFRIFDFSYNSSILCLNSWSGTASRYEIERTARHILKSNTHLAHIENGFFRICSGLSPAIYSSINFLVRELIEKISPVVVEINSINSLDGEAELREAVASLIHMHLNRIMYEWNEKSERSIVETCKRITTTKMKKSVNAGCAIK